VSIVCSVGWTTLEPVFWSLVLDFKFDGMKKAALAFEPFKT
jgi:hypothetical protein